MRLLTVLFFVFSIKAYPQSIPQLDTLILKNGLKVYLLPYGKDSVLNIRLVINGGRKNETSCQVGYSEIIQQLLDETLNAKQRAVSKKKNRLKCERSEGQTLVSSNCSGRYFTKEIELLSTTLLKLSFKQNKMDRIVSSIIDSYKPTKISSSRLSPIFKDLLLYGSKNPLGRTYCQYALEKMLPIELREFYFKYYTPERSSLLICGNFNVNEVKKIITRYFSRWKSLRKEENIADDALKLPKIRSREITFINKRDSKQCLLKWVQPAPPFKSPEHLAFLVTCDLFDRYLMQKIKEMKGINPDSLSFKPVSYTSHFMEMNCTASQNEMNNAINLIDTALQAFHKLKFTETDLQETLRSLKDKSIKNNIPESILSFYDPLLYNFNSRKNYFTNLSGITILDIQTILKKYFDPDAYKLIIVGKETVASNYLALNKNITTCQASDFQTCDETCVPPKKRWKSHSEQPCLFCRNCWTLGRFWGKNRS